MHKKYTTLSFVTVLFIFSAVFLFGSLNEPLVGLGRTGDVRIGGEDGDDDAVADLQTKIEEYEKKVEALHNQASSLANEVEYADSQIYLTELRIQSTLAEIERKVNQIARLDVDIDNLEVRIDKLINSIDFQENVLGERMRARYKTFEPSPFLLILSSNTLNELVQKSKYLKVMELQDKRLLDEMNKTKGAFNFQKDLFEEKKDQAVVLKASVEAQKASLEVQQSNLEEQKVSKKRLLELTQNDEAKYQKLLTDARRELDQITGAASALKNTEPRDVDKGELIGIQGNTGYSFGDHLHFGVYRYSDFDDIVGWNWYYSNTVDPAKKLKSRNVYWNDGCSSAGTKSVGNGSWNWPLSSPTVSQGYGYTCYSPTYYGGNIHPAFDMYGPIGSPVYAAEEGHAYFCRNCLGDGANGVFIFHPDEYMTVYWHLQ